MFQMMGVFAEFERSMIRTGQCGHCAAQADGKHCGRHAADRDRWRPGAGAATAQQRAGAWFQERAAA